MKRLLKWLADEAVLLCVIGALFSIAGVAMNAIHAIHEAGVNARATRRMQKQMAVESVRRGYAELVVNTNTGDFEVRLKEVVK